jgi:hypothetical protein
MTASGRNRFSLSLNMRSPSNSDSVVDRAVRPKRSIQDMSGASTAAVHPLPTSPIKASPSLPMKWPLSPVSRQLSKPLQPMAPVTPMSSRPYVKEKPNFLRKARKLGRLVGGVIKGDATELAVSNDLNPSPTDIQQTSLTPARSNSLSSNQEATRSPSPAEPSASLDIDFAAGRRLSSQSKAPSSISAGSASHHTSFLEQTGGPSTSISSPSQKILENHDIHTSSPHLPAASLAVLDVEEQSTANGLDAISSDVPEENSLSPSVRQHTDHPDRHDQKKHRRIKSVDLSALRLRRTPSVNTISQKQVPGGAFVKRSRSLWSGRVQGERRDVPGLTGSQSNYEQTWRDNWVSGKPMSERQRALNVKRARKMAQVVTSISAYYISLAYVAFRCLAPSLHLDFF